jgi:hypothetical protein
MNFISSHSIVSAYPLMTDSMYGLLNSHQYSETTSVYNSLQKYQRRGFTFLASGEQWEPNHSCCVSGYCGASVRYIGDRTTLVYKFAGVMEGALDGLFDGMMLWRLGCLYPCKLPDPEFPLPLVVASGPI